jgi:hypothetical protein
VVQNSRIVGIKDGEGSVASLETVYKTLIGAIK